MADKDYDSMSLEELKAEAAEQDLEGRSTMNKAELAEALKGGSDTDAGGDDDVITTDADTEHTSSEQVAEEFTDPRQHDPNLYGPSGAATGMVAGDPPVPDAGEGIPADQRGVEVEEGTEDTSEQ